MKVNNVIIYTVSSLFVLSFLFFLIAMGYSSIDSVTASSLNEKLIEYEKKAVEATKLEASRKEWRNIDKVIDQFKNKYFMKYDEFSRFRSDLRSNFMKFRLQLQMKNKVRYTYKRIFKDMTKVIVKFVLTGSYVDIKKLIHHFTTELYEDKMVIFRRIEFHKRPQGDVAGDFLLEVYLAR